MSFIFILFFLCLRLIESSNMYSFWQCSKLAYEYSETRDNTSYVFAHVSTRGFPFFEHFL